MGFAEVIQWDHEEEASSYITGITDDGLVDIVEGEWFIAGKWVPTPVKAELYLKEPYWQYKSRGRIYTTNVEAIALECARKHKVKYVDHEYGYKLYIENIGSDGSKIWWTERDGSRIKFPELSKLQLKAERLSGSGTFIKSSV